MNSRRLHQVMVLMILMLLSHSVIAHDFAAEARFEGVTAENIADAMVKKLFRGVVNVATCWGEIPRQWSRSASRDGVLAGVTVGTANGLLMTVCRAGSGVFDIVTFPSAAPGQYDSLIHPSYNWEPNVVEWVHYKRPEVTPEPE